jgi:hypothetical protein
MPTEKSTLPPTGRSPAGEAVPKPATRPARKFHWRVLAFGLLALAVLFVGLPRIIHALVAGLVLLPAVRSASADTIIAAPGTSCRHQIKDATGRIAHHPAEILHDALVKLVRLNNWWVKMTGLLARCEAGSQVFLRVTNFKSLRQVASYAI